MKTIKWSFFLMLIVEGFALKGQDLSEVPKRQAVLLQENFVIGEQSVGIFYERVLLGRYRKIVSIGAAFGPLRDRIFASTSHEWGSSYKGILGLSYLIGNQSKGKYLELAGEYIYASDPNNGITPLAFSTRTEMLPFREKASESSTIFSILK